MFPDYNYSVYFHAAFVCKSFSQLWLANRQSTGCDMCWKHCNYFSPTIRKTLHFFRYTEQDFGVTLCLHRWTVRRTVHPRKHLIMWPRTGSIMTGNFNVWIVITEHNISDFTISQDEHILSDAQIRLNSRLSPWLRGSARRWGEGHIFCGKDKLWSLQNKNQKPTNW